MAPVEPLNVWRRGCATPSTLSDEVLLARVAETVAWCESRPADADYRTRALSPPLFNDGPDHFVCDVGGARQTQLSHEQLTVASTSPVIAPGRFMLYFPDDNLCDGYAELVSNGFFDVNNVPAHDTWVTFVDEEMGAQRRQLLCYVPAAMVDIANEGIDGNPEQCIVWLEQASALIRHRIEGMVRRRPRGA